MTKRDAEFSDDALNELNEQDHLQPLDEFRDYEQFDDYHEDDPELAAQDAEAAAVPADPEKRQLPLRGLAMILIAVAILLVVWGIFATVSDDGDDTAQTTNAIPETTLVPPHEGDPQAIDPADPAQDQDPANPEQEAAQEDEAAADAAAEQQDPDPRSYQVDVLNNSMVQGLAADVSSQLEASGWNVAEVGNYSSGVVPQNTVYFDAQQPGAETAAREIADQIGGVAVAQDANTVNSNTLVVVLAG